MLFDDAGAAAKGPSAFCRVWFSLLAKGCDSETRVLLATAHKLDDADDQTWPSIIASFEQLAKPIEGDSWGGIF